LGQFGDEKPQTAKRGLRYLIFIRRVAVEAA